MGKIWGLNANVGMGMRDTIGFDLFLIIVDGYRKQAISHFMLIELAIISNIEKDA